MSDKKKRPPYQTKPQEILTKEEAEELTNFLKSEYGNQAAFAHEIGKSTVAVAGWIKTQEFPKYCRLYLEKIRIREMMNLTGEKK